MKKTFKVLVSALLALTMVFSVMSVSFVSAEEVAPLSEFAVQAASKADSKEALGSVSWWYSEVDGKYYMFMPSAADLSSVTVWFEATGDVYCGNTKLENGAKTSAFANGGNYTLTVGETIYSLAFIVSSDLPSIFINTESGNLDAIHADKEHKEKGTMLALDDAGEVVYDNALSSIKGRGNSTWDMPKKPYNIKLDKSANLFGLGKAKSWSLLANYDDHTLLRNQIVYGMAKSIGMTESPDCVNVDLYINGEYCGVYLVSEKVEIKENRVDIYDLEGDTEDCNDKDLDSYSTGGYTGRYSSYLEGTQRWINIPNNPENITGGYLLELELADRYPNEASGFVTEGGQPVVVKTPEYASEAQVQYISGYWQEMEDALYSEDGRNSLGKHYSEYIDVESFAKQYIVQEWTGNWDAGLSSNYFYKDIGGKIIAGPVWDFDTALKNYDGREGYNLKNPTVWHARTRDLYYNSLLGYGTVKSTPNVYALGFRHDDFIDEVWTQWSEKFYGAANELIASKFTAYVDEVKDAAVMNAIRWNYYETTDVATIANEYMDDVNDMKGYIVERTDFLNKNLCLGDELKNDSDEPNVLENLGETFVDFVEKLCYYVTSIFG